jgi:hypothetical protein
LSLPVIIGAGIILLGLLLFFFILKGRSKPGAVEMRPAAQATREDGPMPKAQLIDPQKILFDQPLELTKRSLTIGRDANNDIVINQETVSSLHATIEYKEGFFRLEDQRSSNGTRLNGRPIEPNKAIRLKSGDRIEFDIYECTFFIPGQAPAGKTVLAGGAAAQPAAGTVLRSSQSQQEPAQEVQPQKQKPPIPPEPAPKNQESQPGPGMSVREDKTKIKSAMCPNHPSRKATELCSVCKQAFCKQCMTEKEGKAICLTCVQKM